MTEHTTDLVLHDDRDSWAGILGPVGELARSISATPFVPKDFQGKPAAVAACILMGRAVGVDPMVALQHVSIVQGRPVLSAELMRSLILSNGHQLRFPELTATRAVVEGRRRGDEDWTRVSFNMDEARAAGLAGKDNWRKHPQEMLAARATSRLARLIFADCLGGLSYTADELADVEATAETGAAPAESARRTAKRASKPDAAAPAVQGIAAAPAAPAAAVDEPPLDPPPAAEPEHTGTGEPGVTKAQLQKMHATFNDIGWTGREDRLQVAAAVTGRFLASSNELTRAEAGRLIEELERAVESGSPDAHLGALLMGGGPEVVDGEIVEDVA